MKYAKKIATAIAITCAAGLALAGCGTNGTGSTGAPSSGAADTPVTMTFWHNATTGDGAAFWEKVADDFTAAHPNVTISIQTIQNEDLDGKLQTALNSGSAPDIFLQRGGGKMEEMVKAGQLKDLSNAIDPAVKASVGEGAWAAETLDGKIYAFPVAVLPGGFYYSEDLFNQAGITKAPVTLADLNDVVAKLQAANITPVAVGAKDAWPAAHWYYFFALRECTTEVIQQSAADKKLTDECWTKAGNDLKAFADTKPFNDGFLTTPAQTGASSSAGLVANHLAAMELMGAWNPGVIASLTPDEKPLPDLNWFPFPSIPGGKGAPGSMMGGVDGYSCSKNAPDACAEFLNFALSKDNQIAYYKAFTAPPVSKDAQSAVTEPYMQAILQAFNDAPYVSQWLDTVLGQNIGNALNTGVVDMLAGKGDVAGIIEAVNKAAEKE